MENNMNIPENKPERKKVIFSGIQPTSGAFTLPRLSGDRYAIFTSLTHRFTGRQQTDLLFEPMILQSPQNVNTVCVFAFSMGESTALCLKRSF